ncbi:glycoside hydrolase family 1 protein [Schauerella aestuarii]|uniref:beta-glucosidase n=1 Tax=Schauerella aestuarii TaxID=2511204 RepID=UPI002E29C384|nr:beta-glucosidase [Achromobacter aestuarii]
MVPQFESFIQGGFECGSHLWPDGRRLDLSASTGHAYHPSQDFEAVAACGIRTVRDGICWHLIEASAGKYEWGSALPTVLAATQAGVQVMWDLCHYGIPPHIDVWSGEFPERFAAFAREAARVIRRVSGHSSIFCPINEISYWAWAGGDVSHFGPSAVGRGAELKRQLVRANLMAIAAIKEVDPGAILLSAEPAIHVAPQTADDAQVARYFDALQFEASDMLLGKTHPELGGHGACLDVVGVNFYPQNQWFWGGECIGRESNTYRPLRHILQEIFMRYERPILISETGAESKERLPWFRYVCDEAVAAMNAGVVLTGICLYPITDYPGWGDDRHCETGLLGYPDGAGERPVHGPLADEIAAQAARFDALLGDLTQRPSLQVTPIA